MIKEAIREAREARCRDPEGMKRWVVLVDGSRSQLDILRRLFRRYGVFAPLIVLDFTGARWSLAGAEAVLRLRALRSSGDFDAYCRFHEQQEYLRNHAARSAEGKVVPIRGGKRHHLKRIK